MTGSSRLGSRIRHAVHEYVLHYHRTRNHQGVGNWLLHAANAETAEPPPSWELARSERAGSAVKYYHRLEKAA